MIASPSHLPSMPCSFHLHFPNLASSSSRVRLTGYTVSKNDANSRSRLQVRRAWSELRGVVDTRVASVGMHTVLRL